MPVSFAQVLEQWQSKFKTLDLSYMKLDKPYSWFVDDLYPDT